MPASDPAPCPPPQHGGAVRAARARVRAARARVRELTVGEPRAVEVHALGRTLSAPSASVGALLQRAAPAVSDLDGAALDARALVESLASLHATAEAAVSRVRALDATRGLLQGALERVDDLLDLRACLAGLASASATGDREAAALNVSRFRAIARTLPVPEGEVALVATAEASLLAAVTADFDAAVSEQQALSAAPPPEGGGAEARARVEAAITKCCQLLSLLGRGGVGVQRYAAYVKATLSADCAGDLRACAVGSGAEHPLVALNLASALFARGAAALQSAAQLGGSLFDDGAEGSSGPGCGDDAGGGLLRGVVVVHGVVDAAAGRVVLSFARSGRMQAALLAREGLLL